MTLSTIQEVNGLLIYDLIFAKGHGRDKEKAFVAFRPSVYTFLCRYVSRGCLETQGFLLLSLEENVVTP